jgi:hypothetical protein
MKVRKWQSSNDGSECGGGNLERVAIVTVNNECDAHLVHFKIMKRNEHHFYYFYENLVVNLHKNELVMR